MSDILTKLKHAQQLIDQARFAEAKEVLQRVIRQAPGDRNANVLMRHALTRLGEHQQALYYADQALKTAPDDPELVTLKAMSMAETGDLAGAARTLEPCLQKHPSHALARATLARMYGLLDRLGDCIRLCVASLEAGQRDPRVLSVYASALTRIGRADEAVPIMKLLAASSGNGRVGADPQQLSLLAGTMLYDQNASPREIYAAHYAFGRVLASAAAVGDIDFAQSFEPERRIRLGIISPNLRRHASRHFVEPLLEHIDRERFDVYVYSTTRSEDDVTARYQALATQWRAAARMSPRELSGRMRQDRVDIAIDLAAHAAGGSLLALHLRPAPVQVVWMGHPCTTGLPAMDHRITDSIVDPPGYEEQSTERLVRIDPLLFAWRPPADAPEIDPTPPSAREGAAGATFVSFSAIQKINKSVIALWSRVLKEAPGSRLVLRHRGTGPADVRGHIMQRFAEAGAPQGSVTIEPPVAGAAEALGAYNRADVALDTFPYPGLTTTCEALWMGVPVVTRQGASPHARSGLSAIHAAGLADLAAANDDDFVRIAVDLARDVERRADLRRTLRAKLEQSALRDEKGFARKFENALRTVWRQRCAEVAAAPAAGA